MLKNCRSLLFASVNRTSGVKSKMIVCPNAASQFPSNLSAFSENFDLQTCQRSKCAIPLFSLSCSLFSSVSKLKSFLFKKIQPLFTKYGGGGTLFLIALLLDCQLPISARLCSLLFSSTYKSLFRISH